MWIRHSNGIIANVHLVPNLPSTKIQYKLVNAANKFRGINIKSTQQQSIKIIHRTVLKNIDHLDDSIVITGDFNIGRRTDPFEYTMLKDIVDDTTHDQISTTHPLGLAHTNEDQIDYIFTNRVVACKCQAIYGALDASDHYPVQAEIC